MVYLPPEAWLHWIDVNVRACAKNASVTRVDDPDFKPMRFYSMTPEAVVGAFGPYLRHHPIFRIPPIQRDFFTTKTRAAITKEQERQRNEN